LGFLAHRGVLGRIGDVGSRSATKGYDLVPQGFAVPLEYYIDFLNHPPNAELRAKLADLINAENGGGQSPTKDSLERTEPVLAREQMLDLVDLARRVENAYCAAKSDYYSGREFVTVDNQKQKSLDLEVKLLENRQWVVKQVREFSGSYSA
jgi:hypothetical protein